MKTGPNEEMLGPKPVSNREGILEKVKTEGKVRDSRGREGR